MNILLVAPDQININQTPEIRLISSQHRAYVLNNRVTLDDVYKAAETPVDVIHFATHLGKGAGDSVTLSDGADMSMYEISQIVKISGARLVLFNICSAARLGNFISRHTDACAIYTTIDLPDNEAWKLPLAFYGRCSRLERQEGRELRTIEFYKIFTEIDDETGLYSWSSSLSYNQSITEPLEDTVAKQQEVMDHLQRDVASIKAQVEELTRQQKESAKKQDEMAAQLHLLLIDKGAAPAPLWQKWLVWIVATIVAISSIITIGYALSGVVQ